MKTHLAFIAVIGSLLATTTLTFAHNPLPLDYHSSLDRRGEPPHTNADHASVAAAPAPASVCGNGIVERGEECDCGSPEQCAKDPCCNAKTCKLTAGSQCSNRHDCCDKCQFRPTTFVCRPASLGCEAVEMCTGKSAKCPANKKDCGKHTQHNGTSTAATSFCGDSPCSEKDVQCQAQSTVFYNFTTSCSAQGSASCQMSCINTKDKKCLVLTATFGDGVKCGEGGSCSGGVCVGDQNTRSFFKKNETAFAIAGGSIVAALFLCFTSIFCLRKRQATALSKSRQQEDSYQMTENLHSRNRPRSNVRIGLDPPEGRLVDVHTSDFGGHSTPGLQLAHVRGFTAGGLYPSESLMTEQEMAEALESDSNKRIGPVQTANLCSTAFAGSHSILAKPVLDSTPRANRSPVSAQHVVYVPPPLPPITTLTSPSVHGPLSPYADEAMLVFPPESPPTGSSFTSGQARLAQKAPQTDAFGSDDDEPSLLQLPTSLSAGQQSNARASVSSFFSTLALDPDPEPIPMEGPKQLNLAPATVFSTDEYIMPAPVARKAPPSPQRSPTRAPPATKSPKVETTPEDTKGGSSFAQDLGFEMVDPSPATSPRIPKSSFSAPKPGSSRPRC